jgi:hypothetical protein
MICIKIGGFANRRQLPHHLSQINTPGRTPFGGYDDQQHR